MLFPLTFLALFLLLWALLVAVAPRAWRVLSRLANRAAGLTVRSRHLARARDYYPVLLIVAVGAVITAMAGDAFLDLAELVHENSPRLQEVDRRVHALAASHRSSSASAFFVTMTLIGTPVGLIILLAIVCAGLAIRQRYRWALYLIFTCGVGALLNLELKRYFARARPELAEALRQAHGYSFPSGHAMGSMIVFGALSYVAFRALSRWRWKAASVAAAITIILAIATSRIYLGVHWISDIGAGLGAGAVWVTATTVAYETFRRIRLVQAMRKTPSAD